MAAASLYRVLFDLSYQGRMPVDKSQAPGMDGTTEVVRRRAEAQVPDKKLDDIIIAVRLSLIVMSVHRHCARG
jgi:hypothetical protein